MLKMMEQKERSSSILPRSPLDNHPLRQHSGRLYDELPFPLKDFKELQCHGLETGIATSVPCLLDSIRDSKSSSALSCPYPQGQVHARHS